jgi:hypothetical protein
MADDGWVQVQAKPKKPPQHQQRNREQQYPKPLSSIQQANKLHTSKPVVNTQKPAHTPNHTPNHTPTPRQSNQSQSCTLQSSTTATNQPIPPSPPKSILSYGESNHFALVRNFIKF